VYAKQIPAGLNFCLSGIPYWTTDIGAFFVSHDTYPTGQGDPAYRELFTRWFEYGAFCPIFRVHGTDFPKEMWRFGPETEKTLNQYDELRYRLMPYIYSQAWQVTSHGGTLMRALVMDFPNDKTARESKDEFLFGPSLLICPVIQPRVHSRMVYLPSGTEWTDFWTGRSYPGGTTVKADAPVAKIPIFVRAGAIVPMGQVMQYVDEKKPDPIEINIVPGASGSFTLYEDEGSNNNYKVGKFACIPIDWNDRTRTLTIGKRSGTFSGMLTRRTFRVKLSASGHQIGGDPGNREQSISYAGVPIALKVSP
jgi:alpha-D-xyloside xylohydrolase